MSASTPFNPRLGSHATHVLQPGAEPGDEARGHDASHVWVEKNGLDVITHENLQEALADLDQHFGGYVSVPGSPATITQTYSTTATTVPATTATTVTPTSTTPAPAGGTGAADGAWDTSGHRDTAIAAINALQTDVAALATQLAAAVADDLATKEVLNKVIDILQTAGFAN